MPEKKEWKLDDFIGLHFRSMYGDQYTVNIDSELDLEICIEPNGYESNHTLYVRMDELRRLFGLRGYEIRRKGD